MHSKKLPCPFLLIEWVSKIYTFKSSNTVFPLCLPILCRPLCTTLKQSEYRRYSNGWFVSLCQMFRYLNGGLKIGLKKPVYGPKCPVFEWSSKSRDGYLYTGHPYCLVFRWIRYSGVRYSDGYCTCDFCVHQKA